jgi:hypothetical protein
MESYNMSEATIFCSSRQNSTLELLIVPLMAAYIVKGSFVRQAPYGEDTPRRSKMGSTLGGKAAWSFGLLPNGESVPSGVGLKFACLGIEPDRQNVLARRNVVADGQIRLFWHRNTVDPRKLFLWFKGQRMATGQVNVKAYNRQLRDLIHADKASPSFIISHKLPLQGAPDAYEHFDANATPDGPRS